MWRWNQLFLLQNESFGNHICHKCSYPWGEDCTLITLYQIVPNKLILPCLDIPMDPIRIWNGLLVYWILDNTIVIITIIFRDMNRAMLKIEHIRHISLMILMFLESSTKIVRSTLSSESKQNKVYQKNRRLHFNLAPFI